MPIDIKVIPEQTADGSSIYEKVEYTYDGEKYSLETRPHDIISIEHQAKLNEDIKGEVITLGKSFGQGKPEERHHVHIRDLSEYHYKSKYEQYGRKSIEEKRKASESARRLASTAKPTTSQLPKKSTTSVHNVRPRPKSTSSNTNTGIRQATNTTNSGHQKKAKLSGNEDGWLTYVRIKIDWDDVERKYKSGDYTGLGVIQESLQDEMERFNSIYTNKNLKTYKDDSDWLIHCMQVVINKMADLTE